MLERAYSKGTNSKLASITNHPRDREIIHEFAATNLADSTTFRMEIDMSCWYYGIIELEGENVTFKIEGTLDPDASSGKDVSDLVLGASEYAITTADGEIFFIDTPWKLEKLFIVYTTTNAANAVNIKVKTY